MSIAASFKQKYFYSKSKQAKQNRKLKFPQLVEKEKEENPDRFSHYQKLREKTREDFFSEVFPDASGGA
jgi:hypothetical protein